MASLYSALFVCVCITLLLLSHVAKYYTTTAYASHENSKRTDLITGASPQKGLDYASAWIFEESRSLEIQSPTDPDQIGNAESVDYLNSAAKSSTPDVVAWWDYFKRVALTYLHVDQL